MKFYMSLEHFSNNKKVYILPIEHLIKNFCIAFFELFTFLPRIIKL